MPEMIKYNENICTSMQALFCNMQGVDEVCRRKSEKGVTYALKDMQKYLKYALVFKTCGSDEAGHGLVNYLDTKAKCRQLKKFTCKGTAAGVYRLEIQSVILVFSTHLNVLLPL
jgi:hypothetical protein